MQVNQPQRSSYMSHFCILVVEDLELIAMAMEDLLIDAGYDVLGPAATVSHAFALMAKSKPDGAILDVNLGRERVSPIAQALAEMGIPFVLASAVRPEDLENEPLLLAAQNLGKPTSDTAILEAVRSMVAD